MTQMEKAKELINTFAAGNAKKAAFLLAKGYIQHNLAYVTERDAFIGSVNDFAGAGEQAAFDIFRFDSEGKMAEYWDVMEAVLKRG